ncbi:MAG TPA: PhnD/SsuA/transferrin family substrate-binding protein [Steroidobacteraceae bacterium]|nr:PhnD/SsuA/transferrin family substrate-binding protein [Steroidobacteraceae bacterium]
MRIARSAAGTAEPIAALPIAALPMYDYPELAAAHDALWSAVADGLNAMGVGDPPRILTRNLGHFDIWRHPRLLLGQGCEYPLATSIARCVRLVATPRYAVPGCEGARYRSAVVVRDQDPAETLADLRGRRCAVNEPDSNSGMNFLRAAIAPLSGGARFFESVAWSGSHRKSAEMVANGHADVAALDCVSFAHFQRLYPSSVADLRILCWTDLSPSLPFITALATSDTTLQALRAALASVITDSTLGSVREQLFLDGFDFEPADDFAAVLNLERRAIEFGYPVLL